MEALSNRSVDRVFDTDSHLPASRLLRNVTDGSGGAEVIFTLPRLATADSDPEPSNDPRHKIHPGAAAAGGSGIWGALFIESRGGGAATAGASSWSASSSLFSEPRGDGATTAGASSWGASSSSDGPISGSAAATVGGGRGAWGASSSVVRVHPEGSRGDWGASSCDEARAGVTTGDYVVDMEALSRSATGGRQVRFFYSFFPFMSCNSYTLKAERDLF